MCCAQKWRLKAKHRFAEQIREIIKEEIHEIAFPNYSNYNTMKINVKGPENSFLKGSSFRFLVEKQGDYGQNYSCTLLTKNHPFIQIGEQLQFEGKDNFQELLNYLQEMLACKERFDNLTNSELEAAKKWIDKYEI